MRLILDTNIYCKDFSLAGTTFQALLTNFNRTGNSLFVPRIVLDEVVNKYREEYHKLISQATRIGFTNIIRLPDLNEECDRYRPYFQRKLSAFQYTLLDYPTISHEDLAKKAMENRRPFGPGGQGYRDSLIWETVLDLANRESTDSIAFISSNTRDFANESNHRWLHPHLQEEIERRFADRRVCKIYYYSSLESYVREHIYPALETLSDIETRLSRNTYEILNLRDFVEHSLNDFALGKEFSSEEIGLPEGIASANLSWVNEVLGIEDIAVMKLSERDILVSFSTEVVCEFDFIAYRYDILWDLDDIRPWSDVTNNDEDFIPASISRKIVLMIEIIFNVLTHQITSKQVISAHPSEISE